MRSPGGHKSAMTAHRPLAYRPRRAHFWGGRGFTRRRNIERRLGISDEGCRLNLYMEDEEAERIPTKAAAVRGQRVADLHRTGHPGGMAGNPRAFGAPSGNPYRGALPSPTSCPVTLEAAGDRIALLRPTWRSIQRRRHMHPDVRRAERRGRTTRRRLRVGLPRGAAAPRADATGKGVTAYPSSLRAQCGTASALVIAATAGVPS